MRIVIRVLTFVAVFFEAGVLFFIASTLLLVFMPIAAILYFCLYIAALIGRKKANRAVAAKLQKKRVFVMPADRDTDLSESSFFCGLAKNLAKTNGCAVVVISPFFFSSVGIGEKKPYVNIKASEDGLFICRRVNFFSLRRTVLSKLDTVYFY